MAQGHNTVREGVVAGVLAATAIAIWLLVVDMISGHPFFTPMVLGRGLLNNVFGMRADDTAFRYVAVYTVFHYAAFSAIGVLVTSIIHAARRTPAVLAGFLIMFVAFEFGFYGLASILSVNSDLQSLAWVQIMVANFIASAIMLGYLWRRHPELKREFSAALEGTDA